MFEEINGETLFNSNNTWTYMDTLPPQNTKLMAIEEEKVDSEPTFFKPVVGLYNKKFKGFLKCNSDNRFFNNNDPMKMTLYSASSKKLPAAVHGETMMFKIIKAGTNNEFGLYNCAYSRFVNTQSENGGIILSGSAKNINQNDQNITKWEIIYNHDSSVSFKKDNKFISILDDFTIILKGLDVPDDSCKWEILTLDTIYVGNSNSALNVNVPKYIKYVGLYPLNLYNSSWNDTFIVKDVNTTSSDFNQVLISRSDNPTISDTTGWGQKLYLPGIKSQYLNKLELLFKTVVEGFSREMIIYNNTMVAISKDDRPYYRSLFNVSTYRSSWLEFTRSEKLFGLSIGKINGKMAVMSIQYSSGGLANKIKYRYFDAFIDNIGWNDTPYSNIKQVEYNFARNNLYAIKNNGDFVELVNNSENVISKNLLYFKFSYSKGDGGDALYGISTNTKLVYATFDRNNSFKSMEIIESKTSIKKFDVYNGLVFAIGQDGKLYFKPAMKNIDFIMYGSNQRFTLVDVYVYNNMVYVTDSAGNIFSIPIIVN